MLHDAVASKNPEILQLILGKMREKVGANLYQWQEAINVRDIRGNTPLMWAAGYEDAQFSEILLNNGAAINLVNKNNRSALHRAAGNCHVGNVELLLKYKADVTLIDDQGKTALDLAYEGMHRNKNLVKVARYEIIMTALTLLMNEHEARNLLNGKAVWLGKCLSATQAKKRKRNLASRCEITWQDIDDLSVQKTRQLEDIQLDSERLYNKLLDPLLTDSKRQAILQMAENPHLMPNANNKLEKLLQQYRTANYLQRANEINNLFMQGIFVKNIAKDVFQEDYEDLAVNLGFFAGNELFSNMANSIAVNGRKFILADKIAIGRAFEMSSSVLRRSSSGFVLYDLLKQIKAYQNNDPGAAIGMTTDSIYLGLDLASLGIEMGEVLGLFEGVATYTNPVGFTAGLIVLLGADVFITFKNIKQLDEIIHLTINEKITESLRNFIGLSFSKNINQLLDQKTLNDYSVEQALNWLKLNENFKQYFFPKNKFEIICQTVRYRALCPILGLRSCYYDRIIGKWLESNIRQKEECTKKIVPILNNKIFLNETRYDLIWDRTKPYLSDGNLLCGTTITQKMPTENPLFYCEDALGIEYPYLRKQNYTLIDLGEGTDQLQGASKQNYLIQLGNGKKHIQLAQGNNIVMVGDKTSGSIEAEKWNNTLSLDAFAKNKNIFIKLTEEKGYICNSNNALHIPSLKISNFNTLVLRHRKSDQITVACDTRFVDAQAGKNNDNIDLIIIPKIKNCFYHLTLIVRPFTKILNYAEEGQFTYFLPAIKDGQFNASVDLLTNNSNAQHHIKADYVIYDLNNINNQGHLFYLSFIYNNGVNFFAQYFNSIKRIAPKSIFNLRVLNKSQSKLDYTLRDGTQIHFGTKGIYASQITKRTLDVIVKSYPLIANEQKLTIFVKHKPTLDSIVIGHNYHDVLTNDPFQTSHLIGNGGENIFSISGDAASLNATLVLPKIILYDVDDEHLIDTLDLRQIRMQFEAIGIALQLSLKPINNDLSLQLISTNASQIHARIVLKDALLTHWHRNLHILYGNAPLEIDDLYLKPVPTIFDAHKSLIIVSPNSMENNASLVIPRNSGKYQFFKEKESLFIANVNATQQDQYVIVLQDFYKEKELESLTINFSNTKIILKDEKARIDSAISIAAFTNKENILQSKENQTQSISHSQSKRSLNIKNKLVYKTYSQNSNWETPEYLRFTKKVKTFMLEKLENQNPKVPNRHLFFSNASNQTFSQLHMHPANFNFIN